MSLAPAHARPLARALLLALTAALCACGGRSPADDPTIKRNFANLADQIGDLQTQVDQLHDSVADLATRTEQLGSGGGTAPADIAALRATDLELRQQISDLQTQVASLREALRQSETTTMVTGTPLPEPAPGAGSPAATDQPPAAAEPERQAGVFYVVGPGETLEQIAARHGTTAEAIRQANALPPNAQPYQGTQLFIPQ